MPTSISTHDAMLRTRIDGYIKNGAKNLKADLSSYQQPNDIGGFIPDCTCFHQGKWTLCEAEDSAGLNATHTVDQWKAFDNSEWYFEVVVPGSLLQDFKNMAARNGITVDHWWYNSSY